jgi:hypothetical protein
MPATPLVASERISALGGLEIVFVPTIAASTNIPTRAEIDAGTDLTGEVADWSGFTTTSTTIDTPDLTSFVGKLPGRTEAEDSSISLYADRVGDDARDLLARGTTGFILFMDDGDTAASLMDIYPIQVNTLAKERSMDNATLIRADVSMVAVPVENQAIPAHA